MSRAEVSGTPERGILVLNAGSSSVKFAVYRVHAQRTLSLHSRGEVEAIGTTPHLVAYDGTGVTLVDRRWTTNEDINLHVLLQTLIEWIEQHLGPARLVAAGHRVATGGLEHSEPVRLNAAVTTKLRALVPLAPMHQPRNLEPVAILRKLHPTLLQVACFDSAFHRTMPTLAGQYGLPRWLTDAGARRYGFHGLSYEYIARELPQIDARAATGRTVIAHLGSGASMCGLVNGRSQATTMGFSPLGGVMMATRPGDLDSGLLLWLMREEGLDADALESMLYHECGLLGVSGLSSDMRTLLNSDDPKAREAVDLFVYRVCRELGSLAAAIQGLDALVFTGGIGEHAAVVRSAICRQAAWLDIALDETANRRGEARISTPESKVSVWVIPTDEELMIARHTADIVLADADSSVSAPANITKAMP